MALVDARGREIDSKTGEAASPKGPGLDLANPRMTMDVLGGAGRSFYQNAFNFARLAGPKGERHEKIKCADVSMMAQQGAVIVDFASNLMSELTFGTMEAKARIGVMKAMLADAITKIMPADAVESVMKLVDEADTAVAMEWLNRRMMFTSRIPALVKLNQSIGEALIEACGGKAPTAEDIQNSMAATKATMGIKDGPESPEPPQPEAEAAGNAAPLTDPAAGPGDGAEIRTTEDPGMAGGPPTLRVIDGGRPE